MSKPTLIINHADEVLVQSRQGKPDITGNAYTTLNGQKGLECAIASRKRIRDVHGKQSENIHQDITPQRHAELILKKVKKVLTEGGLNHKILFKVIMDSLSELSFSPNEELIKSKYFKQYKENHKQYFSVEYSSAKILKNMPMAVKATYAYAVLLNKCDSILGLEELKWSPSHGHEGLMDVLRQRGQIIFQGMFGACFHDRDPIRAENLSNSKRHVHFFARNSLRTSPFTHCIIVDQVKLIEGKPFVFFRDPYDDSTPGKPDRVYAISYEKFVERLRDNVGELGNDKTTYGIVRQNNP